MLFSVHLNFVIFECRNFAASYFCILAFSHCSYQDFDGQTEFLQLFNFAVLSYSWNLWKFHARKNDMVYSNWTFSV